MKWAGRSLGYIVALLCLIWVFHDVHAKRLLAQVGNIAWGWVLLGVLFDILSYFSQGVRWSLLMRPVGDIRPLRATQAVYAGLFTNEIMPLRAGEIVRGFLVSRWLSVKLASVVPSMAVERLFDGIWMALGVGLVVMLMELPENLVHAADVLGGIILVATFVFIYLMFRRGGSPKASSTEKTEAASLWQRLSLLAERMAQGIKDIGASRTLNQAFFASSTVLIFQILSFWFVMLGYGIQLSIWAGAAVLLVEHLGTAIPNAPSNVGTYQFFTVVGLSLFNVDKTTATGFSVVVFIVLTLPLWALGLLALSRTGLKVREIRALIGDRLRRNQETASPTAGV